MHCDLDLGDMTLGQCHDIPFRHRQCVKYYPDHLGSEELWPRHRFLVCVHCDLDLGDMTLVKVMTHPRAMGQQLFEILSRSNLVVRS